MRSVIVGIQGPSAAGKSTLARRIAAELGGTIVHELAESEDWTRGTPVGVQPDEAEVLANRRAFLDYECRRWARALSLAGTRPVVFDTEWIGQLLWGLYDLDVTYSASDRDRLAHATMAMYRERVASRALACCDALVLLDPPTAVLRRQREADRTRTRRNFDRNSRVATLIRPMWDELRPLFGTRLMITSDGATFGLPGPSPGPRELDATTALQVLDTISARF